jgi:hypothetical protein
MPRLAQLSSLWGLAVAQAGRGLFLAFGVSFGREVYCGGVDLLDLGDESRWAGGQTKCSPASENRSAQGFAGF